MNDEYLADQKRSLASLLNMRHECSRKIATLQRELDTLTRLVEETSDRIDCYQEFMDD